MTYQEKGKRLRSRISSEVFYDDGIDSGSWLIPYGNMMTILMVFFLILYAFTYFGSNVNYERMVAKIQKDMMKLDNVQKTTEEMEKKMQEIQAAVELTKYLEETGLDRVVRIEIDAQRIKIVLNSPALFPLGKANITDDTKLLLDQIGKTLQKLPNKVVIEGHTDNVPIATTRYRSNWELSMDRSISVVNYFVSIFGIENGRLAVAGYGEYRPLFANDTPENRARNRRIEIIILRTTQTS